MSISKEEIQRQIDRANTDLKRKQESLGGLNSKKAKIDTEANSLKIRLQTLDKELDNYNIQIQNLERDIEKINGELTGFHNKMAEELKKSAEANKK